MKSHKHPHLLEGQGAGGRAKVATIKKLRLLHKCVRRMSLLSNLKDTFIQSVYLLNLESQSQNKSNLKGNEIHCYEYKLSSRRLIVKSNLIESEVHNLFKH